METSCNISPPHLLVVCIGQFSCELWLSVARELVTHPKLCFQPCDQNELLLAMTFFCESVLCCLIFSLPAKEKWMAIFAPLHCLTSIGLARFFCGECFRKPHVLKVLSVVFIFRQKIRSSSQFPSHHIPLKSPYPSWHEMYHRQHLCFQERRSWCVPSPERSNEKGFDDRTDTALSYCS